MGLQSCCTQYCSAPVITAVTTITARAVYSSHWWLLGTSFSWTGWPIPSVHPTSKSQGAGLGPQSVPWALRLWVCGSTAGHLSHWGTPVAGVGWSVARAGRWGLAGAWGRRLGGRVRRIWNSSSSWGGGGRKKRRRPLPWSRTSWCSRCSHWTQRPLRSISSNQGRRGRGGRQIPLVESEDHAHGFLFELSEVSGADIAATVTFVPRPPRTVGHLKLVMQEEREGGILEGETETENWDLDWHLEEWMRGEEMIGVLNKSWLWIFIENPRNIAE